MGDPILPLLGGEGGPRLPTAALGQAGDEPGDPWEIPWDSREIPQLRCRGERSCGLDTRASPAQGGCTQEEGHTKLGSHQHPSIPTRGSTLPPAWPGLVPWAVPPQAHARAGWSRCEDHASGLQTKFIHGQSKPIVPVPALCSRPAAVCLPGCLSLQCAQSELVDSTSWGMRVSVGISSSEQQD